MAGVTLFPHSFGLGPLDLIGLSRLLARGERNNARLCAYLAGSARRVRHARNQNCPVRGRPFQAHSRTGRSHLV